MGMNFELDWETYSDLPPAEQARVRDAAMRHAHALRDEALRRMFSALFRPLRRVGEGISALVRQGRAAAT